MNKEGMFVLLIVAALVAVWLFFNSKSGKAATDKAVCSQAKDPYAALACLALSDPEIARGAGNLLTSGGKAIESGGKAIESIGSGAGGAIHSVGEGAEGLLKGGGNLLSGTGGAVRGIGEGVGGGIRGVGEGVGGGVRGIGEGLGGGFRDAVGNATALPGQIIDKLPDVDISLGLGSVGPIGDGLGHLAGGLWNSASRGLSSLFGGGGSKGGFRDQQCQPGQTRAVPAGYRRRQNQLCDNGQWRNDGAAVEVTA